MRVFWALVAVLVAVAIGIPIVSARSARARAEAERAAAEEARAQAELAARVVAARRETEQDQRPKEPMPAESNIAGTASGGAPAGLSAEPQPTTEPQSPEPAPSVAPEKPAIETKPPPPAGVVATPAAPEAPKGSPTTTAPATEPAADKSPTTTAAPANGAPAPEATPAAKIVTREDGSMLVDDRFVVKGKGTAEAPYEVSWEMLVSANETYDPRVGRKKLPARITMLDGKYVRLVGYVAYPMFVDQPRELLSMLNQWDGCCIGVPPTPYDAVEVHLRDVVTKEERLATYGAVEGKFEVKPYLAGDWLVGLYVLENAGLTVKEYNGFGS